MSKHHPDFALIEEHEDCIARVLTHVTQNFRGHHLWRDLMSALADLITNARNLKSERAALLQDRDAQKKRGDELQAKLDDYEKQAADAAAEIGAEVDAEKPSDDQNHDTTVGPTSTTATDSAGNTTTVPHDDSSAATTTDASGATVATDPAGVAAATSAAQAAGIVIPSAT